MGNYLRNSPTARGMETRYAYGFERSLDSPLRLLQYRTRPGAGSIVAVHLCLPTVKGAPGLAVDVVDAQQPPALVTDFYPGSDTGKTSTNMQDQAAGVVNAVDLDEPQNDGEYATNSVALGANDRGTLLFRGNSAGALAGRRVLRVQIQALVMNRRYIGTALSGNGLSLPAQGRLVIGSSTYRGNSRFVPKVDAFQLIPDLADWSLSPATGVPWTVTEVDNLISAAVADVFGLDVWGKADPQGVRVKYWLRVTHCAENRHGFNYRRGAPRRGWDRYPLSSVSAELANTEYWVEVNALTGSSSDYFTVGQVWPLEAPATDPTDNFSDHRQRSVAISTGPGGAGQEGADRLHSDQAQAAVLLEAAGPTILNDSQAYAGVVNDFVGTFLGVNLSEGQQVTTDASQPLGGYAGITLAVGWWDKTQRPNRPLVLELRHGAGAISGGGTLDATATLVPEATGPDIADVFVRFDQGNVTLLNATQYHVHVKSDAIATGGLNAWRVPRADSRSDLAGSGSGTAVADVQGATQGGSTDSYFTLGVADPRYDLPLCLTAPPAPPASITVTEFPAEPAAVGCVSTLPPRLRVTWPTAGLGSSFGGWRVWLRRHFLPADAPVEVAVIDSTNVPPGLTPAQIESAYREHWISEAGWAVIGAEDAEGWDVGISCLNLTTDLESAIRWTSLTNQPDATSSSWVVSDAARYLSTPLFVEKDAGSTPMTKPHEFSDLADRDYSVVRISGRRPGDRYALHWESDATFPDESVLRGVRAASLSGRQMALLRCRGNRAFGHISWPSTRETEARLSADADFVTTGSDPDLAGPNMPPGYVLDGATQYMSHPHDARLNPQLAPFGLLVAGKFTDVGANAVFIGKGTGTVGYWLWRNAPGSLQFTVIDTLLNTGRVSYTGPAWYDGMYHVAFGVFDGANLFLYVDGQLVAGPVPYTPTGGGIATTNALTVGADQNGTTGFAAGVVNSWGLWNAGVAPTADQVLRSSRYLLLHAGYRATPGASLFQDARDDRAYGKLGVLTDLSGNGLDATIIGSPVLRGVPWPLKTLERKR